MLVRAHIQHSNAIDISSILQRESNTCKARNARKAGVLLRLPVIKVRQASLSGCRAGDVERLIHWLMCWLARSRNQ